MYSFGRFIAPRSSALVTATAVVDEISPLEIRLLVTDDRVGKDVDDGGGGGGEDAFVDARL